MINLAFEAFGQLSSSDVCKLKSLQPGNTVLRPEDHWSCIAHLTAEDMLKSAVIEEKKFKNIECK